MLSSSLICICRVTSMAEMPLSTANAFARCSSCARYRPHCVPHGPPDINSYSQLNRPAASSVLSFPQPSLRRPEDRHLGYRKRFTSTISAMQEKRSRMTRKITCLKTRSRFRVPPRKALRELLVGNPKGLMRSEKAATGSASGSSRRRRDALGKLPAIDLSLAARQVCFG